MGAYLDAMRHYFDFKGRTSRRQYWLFGLVVVVIGAVGLVIDGAVGNLGPGRSAVVTGLLMIPHYIPIFAATARRLHDTGRTGWWQLIGFVPLGQIVMLIFTCGPSEPDANRFGKPVTATPDRTSAQTVAATAGATPIDQIEKLAALRASGAIDQTEFDGMKATLLKS